MEEEKKQKALWKGLLTFANTIKFTIAIKLYGIEKKKERTVLLCKEHMLPIKYEKVCEKGERLSKEDIVHAIKTKNGFQLVEIKKEKKEHIMKIEKFSKQEPMFIKDTYIVKADKGFEKELEEIKEIMLKKKIFGYGYLYMYEIKENICLKAFQDHLIAYVIESGKEEKKKGSIEEAISSITV